MNANNLQTSQPLTPYAPMRSYEFLGELSELEYSEFMAELNAPWPDESND